MAPKLPPRFEIRAPVGAGYLASVWRVLDKQSGTLAIAKVFEKSQLTPEMTLYVRHLHELADKLPPGSIDHMLLPYATGETESIFYQVFEFLDSARDLTTAIKDPTFATREAFQIVFQVATALEQLHRKNIIHSDIKPSNILVQKKGEHSEVFIIDFGMAQRLTDEEVFIVGTYDYLPPYAYRKTSTHSTVTKSPIGQYLDIYATGMVLFEMLATKEKLPEIISEETLEISLAKNGALHDPQLRRAAANLLFQMLTVRPEGPNITAQSVASIADLLSIHVSSEQPRPRSHAEIRGDEEVPEIVSRLESVSHTIAQATAALVARAGELRSAAPEDEDKWIIASFNKTFENVLFRARTSWRISPLHDPFRLYCNCNDVSNRSSVNRLDAAEPVGTHLWRNNSSGSNRYPDLEAL
jgi:serine/threonine protein kinase